MPRSHVTHWTRRAVVATVLLLGVVALLAPAAHAGALTNMNWTVSNSLPGATNVAYTFNFKTATAGTVKTVTMTVPGGTAGTAAVGAVYGVGAGTISLATNTLTYTVTSAVSIPANTLVYITVTGLTNAGAGSFASAFATNTSVPAVIDSGTANSLTFAPSTTGVTVNVGQTLIFTNDTSSFSLAVDASGANTSNSQVVNLSVKTNAGGGYTLQASDNATGLYKTVAPNATIPAVAGVPAGPGTNPFPAVGWGVSATATGGTLAPGFTNPSAGSFVKYATAPATFMSRATPTGATADTVALTNQVAVDMSVAGGQYTDTITYLASANY